MGEKQPNVGTYSKAYSFSTRRLKVSVLIPVYNGIANYPENMLVTSIQSTLDQETEQIAIQPVVVINGCTDNTYPVLKETFGDKVLFIRSKYNIGMANGASLAGFHAVLGDYHIIQSVRSWYEPNSFEKMVEVLAENKHIGFVYGKTQYHGELTHLHNPNEYKKEDFYKSFNSLFGYMYRREVWNLGCRYIPFLHRDGIWYDMADRDFQMQMIEYLNLDGYFIDETVLHYYYGGEQMTKKMKEYQTELDTIWKARWPNVVGGFGGNEIS